MLLLSGKKDGIKNAMEWKMPEIYSNAKSNMAASF
jgi:hypothetical protein